MMIEEKGLVRAIKQAYAMDGYSVLNLGEQVAIYTRGWFVRCDWRQLPRKALATIVEHMGLIPGDGDAVSIIKGDEPQAMIPEVAGQDIETWTQGGVSHTATMVPLMFRGLQVYQEEGVGACYGADPMGLAIMERDVAEGKAAAVAGGHRLKWEHDGEMVCVAAQRKNEYWVKGWEQEVWNALEGVDLHRKEE